jgi:hypothetical protein
MAYEREPARTLELAAVVDAGIPGIQAARASLLVNAWHEYTHHESFPDLLGLGREIIGSRFGCRRI